MLNSSLIKALELSIIYSYTSIQIMIDLMWVMKVMRMMMRARRIQLLLQSVIQSRLVGERISKMTESDGTSLTFITISLLYGRYRSPYPKRRYDKKRVMNI